MVTVPLPVDPLPNTNPVPKLKSPPAERLSVPAPERPMTLEPFVVSTPPALMANVPLVPTD